MTVIKQYQSITVKAVINRSEFLAHVWGNTEEEARVYYSISKHKHYHNCSAYSIGLHLKITFADDHGEPSGTAGKPILFSTSL